MDDKNEFVTWLYKELEKRKWSQSDLARHAGLKRQVVSRLVTGDRNAGADSCKAIAAAFDLPEEIVFRKAGILSARAEVNERVEILSHRIAQLPQEDQARVEAIIDSLLALKQDVGVTKKDLQAGEI